MQHFDVVAVGGGPAGTATTLALARRGFKTALVERTEDPPPRAGETLPGAVRNALLHLGVLDRFLADDHDPAVGNRSCWGSDEVEEVHFIHSAYGTGWHIDRQRFERMLLAAAEESGVTLVRGASLDALSFDGSTWRVRAGSSELNARYVIDATGRASTVARICGADRVAIDQLVGITAFFSSNGADDPQGKFTFIEASEHGWWYSAPLPGARLVVAYFTDSDLADVAQWNALLPKYTRERIAAYTLAVPPRVASANTARLSSVIGPAWLVVGDSAVSFDPLSSQGILSALESALDAAQAIASNQLDRYAELVTERYRDYLVNRARYYAVEKRWPDSPFWMRRQKHAVT
jgi:flavin-dependent dehydrogenase